MTSYGQFYSSTPSVVPWHYSYTTGIWPFETKHSVLGAYTQGVFEPEGSTVNAPMYPHSNDWILIDGKRYYATAAYADYWAPIFPGDTLTLVQDAAGHGRLTVKLNP